MLEVADNQKEDKNGKQVKNDRTTMNERKGSWLFQDEQEGKT